MRIVVAIGGNSLIKDSKKFAAHDQLEQVTETSKIIANIAGNDQEIVITHGNGPQVGYLLRMSELAEHEIPLFPLDYCVANTQGSIGYQMQNALRYQLEQLNIHRKVVTLVTQTIVDKDDPAFQHPSKPIGSFFNKEEIEEHAKAYGWEYIEDSGRGYRRVVPSPVPKEIVEKDLIELMLRSRALVIAVGGGGIPVIKENDQLVGKEAVIDKDLASSLLAREIKADLFVISTAVSNAFIHFNRPNQQALETINIEQTKMYLSEGYFGKGSMEPKIKAALQFTEATGNPAVITSPENIPEAIMGRKGTRIEHK